jgi:hypothetical protein
MQDQSGSPNKPVPGLSPVGARIVSAIEEAIEAMRAGKPLKTTIYEVRRGHDEKERPSK